MMKKIAVINDLSGFGKCSLTAAIPVVSVLGVQCVPLVTSVFSAQTGYINFHKRDLTEDMQPIILQWQKMGASFDGILSGFISSKQQGEITEGFIDTFKGENTTVVVDPVMADDGEIYKCFDTQTVKAICAITEKADIITPNLTELCVLCQSDYGKFIKLSDEELICEIEKMSRYIQKSKRVVVTTGVHLKNGKTANVIYENGKVETVCCNTLKGSFSGTGDIFSSVIAAEAVKNVPIKKAVQRASDFIFKAIESTLAENPNINRNDGINFETYLKSL